MLKPLFPCVIIGKNNKQIAQAEELADLGIDAGEPDDLLMEGVVDLNLVDAFIADTDNPNKCEVVLVNTESPMYIVGSLSEVYKRVIDFISNNTSDFIPHRTVFADLDENDDEYEADCIINLQNIWAANSNRLQTSLKQGTVVLLDSGSYFITDNYYDFMKEYNSYGEE